uniref:Cell division cycle protein 27 homolog n=1 Tax=Strongyloides stercoralis TaxID=6248 RepID=A0A913I4T8_STRER
MLSQTSHNQSTSSSLTTSINNQDHIEDAINKCLKYYAVEDALVLAEAYFAKVKSNSALCLLVHCYIQKNQYHSAFKLLEDQKSKSNDGLYCPETRFLHAKCAYKMGKNDIAEFALKDDKSSENEIHLHSCFNNSESRPFAHALLAQILRESGRHSAALVVWESGMKQYPVLWSSIKDYCDVGGGSVRKKLAASVGSNIETKRARFDCPPSISTESLDIKEECIETTPVNNGKTPTILMVAPKKAGRRKSTTPCSANSKNVSVEGRVEIRRSQRLLQTHGNENLNRERIVNGRSGSSTSMPRMNMSSEITPNNKKLPSIKRIKNWKIQNSPENNLNSPEVMEVEGTRKSKRSAQIHNPLSLVNRTNSEVAQASLSDSTTSLASNTSSCIKSDEGNDFVDSSGEDRDENYDCIEDRMKEELLKTTSPLYFDILNWICKMSEIQECLSGYLCQDALERLDELPGEFQSNPLVLELRARALFERGDYKSAADIFQTLRELYPHRLDGMEVLSTALWHLQDASKLSALANELVKENRTSAIAWCVAGNCFSVQKLHETAIECLQRSIILNPRFAYAYSVLGHELIDIDKLDDAIRCFRKAITLAPKDYRAYFGMGMIYQMKENYPVALTNFEKAVACNPSNTKLLCQLGVCEQALRRNDQALKKFDDALKINPNDIATKFHKARLLYETKEYEKSLEVLKDLKLSSPNEAQIFFLLGHVYKKLGEEHMSNTYFNWASDIDPRGEQSKPLFGSVRNSIDDEQDGEPESIDEVLNEDIFKILSLQI